ncbi:MAG: PHP domain-containing protein [Kiritimatiellae bacterium]|jgi:PHP family Zn ribbon phosphoesterase|nr:PHP domain-containing protein [Kiritimatiellia bacterium]
MFKFDLHIHSCLSPCGDLECSPLAIVQRAKEVGLDGLMIADHNTSRNSAALAEACRREGLKALFGMELMTAEEVHCLAIFDTIEQAAEMTESVYASLPKRVNQPEVFGYQPVVNVDEEIEEFEWRMLSAPSRLMIREAGERVHQLGGFFAGAHIDRAVFSITSQLGSLSGDEGFDAVELSRHVRIDDWRDRCMGLPVLRNSDAHYLDGIGSIYNVANLSEFSVSALKEALSAGKVSGSS